MATFTLEERIELGAGGYGKVVRAKNNETGELVAAKIISTSRMKTSAIEKEVKLMGKLVHPNIIGLKGVKQEGKSYLIYMELAAGGELFSRVITAGNLDEPQARPYFLQLMSAVKYMHSLGVVHRDLKLENILLDGDDVCKVCDFGLAHDYGKIDPPPEERPSLREVCGSKSYCAPEVLEGKGYDGPPTDVWSCGICLFAMLAGFFPLDEASGADWRFGRVKLAASNNTSACHTIFGFYERQCTLSADVVDLIDSMLTISPAKRWSVEKVLSCAWIAKTIPGSPHVYRGDIRPGGPADMTIEDWQTMFEEDENKPSLPVYRGAAGMSGPSGPPPMLQKQVAFGADFHVEEKEA